jgi:hypothetical protein
LQELINEKLEPNLRIKVDDVFMDECLGEMRLQSRDSRQTRLKKPNALHAESVGNIFHSDFLLVPDYQLQEYARSVVELRILSWFTASSLKVLQQRVCEFEKLLGISQDDSNLQPFIDACPGLECDRLSGINDWFDGFDYSILDEIHMECAEVRRLNMSIKNCPRGKAVLFVKKSLEVRIRAICMVLVDCTRTVELLVHMDRLICMNRPIGRA